MLIKHEAIVCQKPGSRDFWRIANSVLNKGKSAIPPLFNGSGPEVLPFASKKAKPFAENISKNSNIDDLSISLSAFSAFPFWCGYFRGPWVSLVTTDEFSVRVTKINSRIVSHELTTCLSVFNMFLTQ